LLSEPQKQQQPQKQREQVVDKESNKENNSNASNTNKSKSFKKIQEYRAQSINSLFRLYPRIDKLGSEERHMVLFGADHITA